MMSSMATTFGCKGNQKLIQMILIHPLRKDGGSSGSSRLSTVASIRVFTQGSWDTSVPVAIDQEFLVFKSWEIIFISILPIVAGIVASKLMPSIRKAEKILKILPIHFC